MSQIKEHIARLKLFYQNFLDYVDCSVNPSESLQQIITFIKDNNYGEDVDELRSILHIIYKISSQHIRNSVFLNKVYQIILHFKDKIKQTFSNSDIFRIFRSDKLLLLFLIKQKIITIDEKTAILLVEKHGKFYSNFFYPEIKPFLTTVKQKTKIELFESLQISDENFEEKRQEGENDSPICRLIRNDSIDEFISVYNDQKLKPEQTIPQSIFETNIFLSKNETTTIIDYASFFSSTKIVKFLLETGENVPKNIWTYAIHSGNIDFVYFIEEMGVEPFSYLYDRYFLTAVKCHYNILANDLYNYFFEGEEKEFDKEYFSYYNFEFLDDIMDNYEKIFDYACNYDYSTIVKIILNENKVDIKQAISKIKFFFIKLKMYFLYDIFSNDIKIKFSNQFY